MKTKKKVKNYFQQRINTQVQTPLYENFDFPDIGVQHLNNEPKENAENSNSNKHYLIILPLLIPIAFFLYMGIKLCQKKHQDDTEKGD